MAWLICGLPTQAFLTDDSGTNPWDISSLFSSTNTDPSALTDSGSLVSTLEEEEEYNTAYTSLISDSVGSDDESLDRDALADYASAILIKAGASLKTVQLYGDLDPVFSTGLTIFGQRLVEIRSALGEEEELRDIDEDNKVSGFVSQLNTNAQIYSFCLYTLSAIPDSLSESDMNGDQSLAVRNALVDIEEVLGDFNTKERELAAQHGSFSGLDPHNLAALSQQPGLLNLFFESQLTHTMIGIMDDDDDDDDDSSNSNLSAFGGGGGSGGFGSTFNPGDQSVGNGVTLQDLQMADPASAAQMMMLDSFSF